MAPDTIYSSFSKKITIFRRINIRFKYFTYLDDHKKITQQRFKDI